MKANGLIFLGTGEAVIRTAFARTLAEALCAAPPEETHNILQTKLEAFRGEHPHTILSYRFKN